MNSSFLHPSAPEIFQAPSSLQPFTASSSNQMQHESISTDMRPTNPQSEDKEISDQDNATASSSKKKKQLAPIPTKRRKVNHACKFCRRSHMTCDEGRPCQRCIKREIGHLCHDEPKQGSTALNSSRISERNIGEGDSEKTPIDVPRPHGVPGVPFAFVPTTPQSTSSWPLIPQSSISYPAGTLGNEFSVLTDFLESLDERAFFNGPQNSSQLSTQQSSMAGPSNQHGLGQQAPNTPMVSLTSPNQVIGHHHHPQQNITSETFSESNPILPAATKTEQFFLTAADQASGTRDERLAKVIQSKYEAGLLKPHNYVTAYARLSRWMERNVSPESRQQILQPLSVLRPKFRAIAQSLTDIDLVFIEEAFERLLLDYDRVFSAMGIPACLWRRTGEIYKGNREFAQLVGVDVRELTDGRLCIYELMSEESAVNYWEKYGQVAFDPGQKAVLTSCVLRYKLQTYPSLPESGSLTAFKNTRAPREKQFHQQQQREEIYINCCFSFTIRRDAWGIPTAIIGNFIQY